MKRTHLFLIIALVSSLPLMGCDDSAEQLITETPAPRSAQNPPPGGGGGGATLVLKAIRLEPRNESTAVSVELESLEASFDKNIDTASFSLTDERGNAMSGKILISGTRVTFQPDRRLHYATTYNATIAKVTKAKDGSTMTADVAWSFSTAAEVAFRGTKQITAAGNQTISGIAIDSLDDVYTVGFTDDALEGIVSGTPRPARSTDVDAFLLKWNSGGELLWGRRLRSDGNDFASSVAIDASGNIYVLGHTTGMIESTRSQEEDIFIVKFSPHGDELWRKQHSAGGRQIPTTLLMDGAMAYIVGTSNGPTFTTINYDSSRRSDTDIFIAQISAEDGALVNGSHFDSLLADDSALTATLVDMGNSKELHIAATTTESFRGSPENPARNGMRDTVWMRVRLPDISRYISVRQMGTSLNDFPHAIAADANGNTFIGGYIENVPTRGDDQFLVNYSAQNSANFNIAWRIERRFTESERYIGIMLAENNSLLLLIDVANADGTRSGAVERVSQSNGQSLGRQTLLDAAGATSLFARDSKGFIYATGYSTGALAGAIGDGRDIYLMKLAPDLSIQ